MIILNRRLALLGGLAGLSACATQPGRGPGLAVPQIPLAPVRARKDRLFDITVCLRPFRAAGPRLDTEMLGDTLVVHNYGHGGSGWSLSWGSASVALEKALSRGQKDIAVIGCGALGLTTAVQALRAGCTVTLYTKELVQQTRSSRATGSWTPDSRISLRDPAGPQFGALWEKMARISWKTYRTYMGLPGAPVEFRDRYFLADGPASPPPPHPPGMEFGQYMRERTPDLMPRSVEIAPQSTPFRVKNVRLGDNLQFNIASYAHTLMTEFFGMGGKLEIREFHEPSEFTKLKQKVVINCTGYGARALWKDDSLVPVRGQIGWLIPQADMHYGIIFAGIQILSRPDGIVVQDISGGEMKGYNDDREVVDRAETENALAKIEELNARNDRA